MAIKDTRQAAQEKLDPQEAINRQFDKAHNRMMADVEGELKSREFSELKEAPGDDDFEFEEPSVPQVGPTAAEAAEEDAELEAGQYGIPSMAKSVAKRVLPPRLTEEQDAQFLKDLEDLPEPTEQAKVSREDTFKGAGNYTYAKTADGDWFFTSPSGKTGVAKKGTPAFESIASEAAGKGSLWGREGYAGPTKAEGEGAAPEGQSWADAQVDPEGYYAEAEKEEADEKPADEKEADEKPTEPLPEVGPVKGKFTLSNPPALDSPRNIDEFLKVNPGIKDDPQRLLSWLNEAYPYADPRLASQRYLDTVRASDEYDRLSRIDMANRTWKQQFRVNALGTIFQRTGKSFGMVGAGGVVGGSQGVEQGLGGRSMGSDIQAPFVHDVSAIRKSPAIRDELRAEEYRELEDALTRGLSTD